MKPDEKFTVVTGTPKDPDPDEAPFEVVFHDQGASVWVNIGDEPTVHDHSGSEIDCGHRRPVEVLRSWTEATEAAAEHPDLSAERRAAVRGHAQTMRWHLARAGAIQECGLRDVLDDTVGVPAVWNSTPRPRTSMRNVTGRGASGISTG
ncbi:hypothetical protein [Kitasatospora sp. NPDC097691]|uniref:hypothetical protein n=1 Tax=Kitasatospora sp. NPDC097691 TaxID=3157231 RepID=UPI00332C965C